MTKKQELWQMFKFVLFSASAGLIQLGSFTIFNEVFKWKYWPAYLLSLTLSVLWNFTFNRKFTFNSAKNVPIAMLKVFGYYLIFTPLSTLWGDALEKVINEYIVLAFTMIINLVTEFLYQKYFVFNDNNSKDKNIDDKIIKIIKN